MTTLHERAKLRLNQQNKLNRACDNIEELIKLHMPEDQGEREIADLAMMKARLTALIKHQHVIDAEYRNHKIELEGY